MYLIFHLIIICYAKQIKISLINHEIPRVKTFAHVLKLGQNVISFVAQSRKGQLENNFNYPPTLFISLLTG